MSILFLKSCNVAYQINGNDAENTMQANILPFYIPTTPGLGQKVKIVVVFLKAMLHIKLKGEMLRTLYIKMFDLMHIPELLGWVKSSDIQIVQISIILF